MTLPQQKIEVSYDYPKAIAWLRSTGTRLTGKPFIITAADKGIIFAMLAWFLEDELAAEALDINLSKGIMLSGPIGCGKTTLFRIMQKLPAARSKFRLRASRNIVSEFMQEGYPILEAYSYGSVVTGERRRHAICFDDLGTETSSKYFGNDCNVMAEILLTRYDLFREKNLITHLTTNLTASEIETQYGNRLRSRMREMFNLFGYSELSKDKRV